MIAYRDKFLNMPKFERVRLMFVGLLYLANLFLLATMMVVLLEGLTINGQSVPGGGVSVITLLLLYFWFGPEFDMGFVWMEVLWIGMLLMVGLALLAAATTFLLNGTLLAAVGAAAGFGAVAGHVATLYFGYVFAVYQGVIDAGASMGRMAWSRAATYLTSKVSKLTTKAAS